MPASIKIPTIFTAVDKFSDIVSRMSKNVKKFGSDGIGAVKRFDNTITSSFKRLSNLSQLALGLGFGAIFMSAINNNIAYEDSLASVAAVTGATGKDLAFLEQQAMKTAKSQKMLGADVFKAYELIASAKPELLTNTKLLDEVTNAAVTLSKAARMELGPASDSLTTSLNQFGLGGEKALSVIDNLAAGTVYGASSIVQTSDALSKFGTIAAATGTKIDESIALIQLVSPFEKGAEAGTKLRNVLSNMASAKILPPDAIKAMEKYGVRTSILTSKTATLDEKLKEMSKIGKDTTAVIQVFGKENAGLAQGLLNNADKFDEMLINVNKSGAAMDMAKTNTNTFKFALDSIKTSFLNTTTATQSNNATLDMFKSLLFSVGDNMDTIVTVVLSLVAAYVLMKAIIITTTALTWAYNVALGVSTAVTNTNNMALIGNVTAQNAYKVAMAISTAVTWLATSAFGALAIAIWSGLWPVLAIIAAVVAIVAIFLYWDEICAWFGAQWSKFTGWISELWGKIVSFFQEFDLKSFFIGIGQAIIEWILFPLKMVLRLVALIPGKVGKAAQSGLDKLNEMTDLEAMVGDKKAEVLPSTGQAGSEAVINSKTQNNVAISIKDKGKNVESVDQKGQNNIPIFMSNTQNAF
jgi:TP901 family phage tail tape measure protein